MLLKLGVQPTNSGLPNQNKSVTPGPFVTFATLL